MNDPNDMFLGSHLVQRYRELGSLQESRTAFDQMQSKNVITWTEMMGAYLSNKDPQECVRLFYAMQLEGIPPDSVTFATVLGAVEDLQTGQCIHRLVVESGLDSKVFPACSIVSMYGRLGAPDQAADAFKIIQQKNVVAWTCMLAAYAQSGHSDEAIATFRFMQQAGIPPNPVTLVEFLSACGGNAAALKEGTAAHMRLAEAGLDRETILGSAILSMYGRCGRVEEARNVFKNIREMDYIAWNAMVAVYAQNGHLSEAFRLLNYMQNQGVEPTSTTFVSILSACSHAGLVHLALENYVSMQNDYGIEPVLEHHGCIIDLLGKTGRLDDAELLVGSDLDSDLVTWMSFLNSCRFQNDAQKGQEAAHKLIQLDASKLPSISSCLFSMY